MDDFHYNHQFVQGKTLNEDVKSQYPTRFEFYEKFEHERAQYITGTVYNNGEVIQTFIVNDDNDCVFTDVETPVIKVARGIYTNSNRMMFEWNSTDHNSYIVCDYEY